MQQHLFIFHFLLPPAFPNKLYHTTLKKKTKLSYYNLKKLENSRIVSKWLKWQQQKHNNNFFVIFEIILLVGRLDFQCYKL